MTMNRAADILAQRLYEAGCRHAFGMPGGEVLTLVDALRRAGIRFTLIKHENSGGFMAEGTWHRTGAPGILVGTIGPGILNGVNTVANAWQDRVPLIVLTGCVDADEAQTYTHQVLDHQKVFDPVTKATFRLSAASAGIITDKAIGIATEGRPGPVMIDVPIGVADKMVEAPARPTRPAASAVIPSGPDMDRARDWLSQAVRPVMIAGLDAVNEGASDALRSFCERHNVPLITTYKGKGLMPEDHPLSLGGAGLSPLADRVLVPFVQQADLIICAGYDPIEMRPGWRNIWDPARVNVIDIAAVPNDHYMHQATLNFVASTGPTLEALSDGSPPQKTWQGDAITAARTALAQAFPTDEEWGAAAIVDQCRQTLPANTLASADSGAHRILLSQMWRCPEPRALVQSSALCTMGCAVPLAMGMSIADPDRTVVSFSGDAGFLMVAGELASAAELNLRTIFVVFVDNSLALIELKQRQRQMANEAVDFGAHDYAAIGRSFGGNGVTVSTRQDLIAALEEAQHADRFTVIAALIGRRDYDGRI